MERVCAGSPCVTIAGGGGGGGTEEGAEESDEGLCTGDRALLCALLRIGTSRC